MPFPKTNLISPSLKRSALVATATAAFSLGLAAFGPVRPASAWYASGHAVIAMMAYRQMKPATRAAIDTTLQAHPDYKNWLIELPANVTPAQRGEYVFAIASTWPDRIKDARDESVSVKFADRSGNNRPAPPPGPKGASPYPDLNPHNNWHYYDIPITMDNKEHKEDGESAITALPVFRKNIAAPGVSASNRAYYLAWLVHVLGDVHQPLHAVSRFSAARPTGDGGGNAVKFQNDGASTTPKNLHGFWDSLLGDGPDPKRYNTLQNGWDALNATIATINTEAPRLMQGYDPQTQNNLDENEWIKESYREAQEFVYTFGDPDSDAPVPQPDSEYRKEAVRVSHQRALLAAHRLALICDAAYTPAP